MQENVELPACITPQLIEKIKESYQLNWDGMHGWRHWVRVYENGLKLAQQNGANQLVVALFAFTHDMAREHDQWDDSHGPRAAQKIRAELQGVFFQLQPEELEMLVSAVELHTNGLLEAHITVQTCWDADRLDLGRAGIRPIAQRLCTPEARDPATIEWAYQRSRR